MNDLQALGTGYDARLPAALRLNALLLRRIQVGGVQTALGRLTTGIRFEVAANALAVFLLGGFAAANVRHTAAFAAAVVLDAYALAALISGIAQLGTLARIDDDEPVAVIARALGRLRLLRVRNACWILATAPLMWSPLLIVALRAVAGLDASVVFAPPWLAANVVFGIVVLAAAFWLARRFGGSGTAGTLRPLFAVLSGASIRSAGDQRDTLERYEADVERAASN